VIWTAYNVYSPVKCVTNLLLLPKFLTGSSPITHDWTNKA